MMRIAVGALLALGLFVGAAAADDKPVKNQMVKGTVKSVDVKTSVLIVSQKVKNETVDDVDVWFFDCRHFFPADAGTTENDENVTVTEDGGLSIYRKWMMMEALRAGRTATWPASQIRQFYKPSIWFGVLVRYRKLHETKQREEFIDFFPLLASERPLLTLETTTDPSKEFHVNFVP